MNNPRDEINYFSGIVYPSDIRSLDNIPYEYENIYSIDDRYVLTHDFDKVIHSPEFKIIGCLNGYIYTSEGLYIGKYTDDGVLIGRSNLEVLHGTFFETLKFFYCWFDNILYKVSDQLEVEWSREFDLDISSAYIDCKGDCYVLFESSRTIRKILKSGDESVYIDGSDNPEYDVTLHRLFITKGGGWLYVLGTELYGYNNTLNIFIDKYNTRTWEKVERLIVSSNTFVTKDDPEFTFIDFVLSGDYYYLLSQTTLTKINIKGLYYWTSYAVNFYGEPSSIYKKIEYSDNPYTDSIYVLQADKGFIDESYNDSYITSFNKYNTSGNMLWGLDEFYENSDNVDVNFAYYKNKIYSSSREYIKTTKGYVLSLDDNSVLFQTRDNNLVKVVKYNSEELFSADNYYGMRLLASNIKDGISKIEYTPLLHDDGHVVNENNDLILLPIENEHYTDIDNYDYKYLLASRYSFDPPEISLLYTKSLQPMLTKLKNVLKTKVPIIPDTIHEFITNANGLYLDTADDFDLVRARYQYSFDKYLLADLNMFSTNIVTKDLEYTIITKKYGHDIIMKTRKIYTYIFKKYSEMDLIAQWLKENGVMDTNLPEIIEELKHHTYSAIQDIQVAGTPQIYDVQPYKQFEYTFDGYKYANNTWGTQIFSCTNLPWDKRKCIARIYIDSLANIIKKQEMRPILFFLNGKAIPWSDCVVVRDWSYSYIIIKNHSPYDTELSSIIFPCDIRYGEDSNVLDEDQINGYFYFDEDGKSLSFDNRDKTTIRIEVIDKNIWGAPTTETPFTVDGTTLFEVINKENQKSSDKNLIVFEDGVLFPDARYYMRDKGKDVYEYTRPVDNIDLMVKAFYWIKANPYYGIEEKPENQSLILKGAYSELFDDIMIYDIYGNTNPIEDNTGSNKFINYELYSPFDFKMERSKTYEQNIADAISYIVKYDRSLLKKYWEKLSYISTFTYDGEYIINRVPKDGGWLLMPRSRKSNFDDYIMVFRNGRIYEYYKEIEYTDCYFKIPIFNHIERTDTLEIIHFKNVNNNYYTLTVDKDVPDYISEDLRYDDFLLSGNSPSTEEVYVPFNKDNSIQYDIAFKYKNNFNANNKYVSTEIELEDEYYYGKRINVYSKHQFHYMYYNMFSPKDSVNLTPDFRFCHEKNKYMVFINGVKYNSNLWTLNIMSNESSRQYISISFSHGFIQAGDLVEIFYIPISITSDTNNMILHTDNDDTVIAICMDWRIYGEVEFPIFDKDFYNVFINGEKINHNHLHNESDWVCCIDKDTYLDIDSRSDDYFTRINTVYSNQIQRFQYANAVETERYTADEILLGKLCSYTESWTFAVGFDHNFQYNKSESETRELLRKVIPRLKL